MEKQKSIYCVACACLVPEEQVKKVFHTGFYRIQYRLGLCLACSEPAEADCYAPQR